MTILSRNALKIADFVIISLMTLFTYIGYMHSGKQTLVVIVWYLIVMMFMLNAKGFYRRRRYKLRDFYLLFECITVATTIIGAPIILAGLNFVSFALVVLNSIFIYLFIAITRLISKFGSKIFCRTKNVLIVGAGQDGKLIAKKIQEKPYLGMKVVGYLDDNMNTIEDQDSTIPILGLTCDSSAVIKENNVKVVIIAVRSRMDSDILTDLVKGIPLGVKVWRMPKFYEKITQKYLISKMAVNWLFYSCVKKRALIYSYLKRIADIIAALLILILTLPLSIIAGMIVKFSDFGPIFYLQNRTGKFGKPFKMIKFRTMYRDIVENNFDDDLSEVTDDDKRIIPMCKFLRKYHIDELPQVINVLRGEMSIIGPRPIREEVDTKNKEDIPFWECRSWVRPGICGWQQVNIANPEPQERLEYDLYYIKHQQVLWEVYIFAKYIVNVLLGRNR